MKIFKTKKSIYITVIIIILIAISFSITLFKINEYKNQSEFKKISFEPKLSEQTHDIKVCYFYLVDSEACLKLDPVYEEVKAIYKENIDFEKIEVDKNVDITNKYQINLSPTIITLNKDGNVINRKAGLMTKDEFITFLEEAKKIMENK